VLVTTSNFGNRYVGKLNLQLDTAGAVVRDPTGVPVLQTGTAMRRVSGRAEDADRVTGDVSLQSDVIAPLTSYISALNAQVAGVSQVVLNGERGAAQTATTPFAPGVRNAETNLGNLVADAMRFAGGTDIALQNGGGIRASINAGDITRGETFDTLPFTNLVVKVEDISPAQLKSLLEHGVAASTPEGSAQGRFPQISGMSFVYDSQLPAGGRVREVSLNDGTKLVEAGAVVAGARSVSMSTIDFLANGGDGYPFIPLGLDYENLTNTILYQEALENFLDASIAEGGLGGLVSAANYPVPSPFDLTGRIVDVSAVPEPTSVALLLSAAGVVLITRRRRNAA
jgi:5'-nucleotidase